MITLGALENTCVQTETAQKFLEGHHLEPWLAWLQLRNADSSWEMFPWPCGTLLSNSTENYNPRSREDDSEVQESRVDVMLPTDHKLPTKEQLPFAHIWMAEGRTISTLQALFLFPLLLYCPFPASRNSTKGRK